MTTNQKISIVDTLNDWIMKLEKTSKMVSYAEFTRDGEDFIVARKHIGQIINEMTDICQRISDAHGPASDKRNQAGKALDVLLEYLRSQDASIAG